MNGHTLYGYTRDADGRVKPHATEAAVVREALKLRTEGMTYGAIATTLNRGGATPRHGGSFDFFKVARIIQRTEIYLSGDAHYPPIRDLGVTKAALTRAGAL